MLRILVFLVISAAAHVLAARWLLAVSPRARRLRTRVLLVALALSTLAAGLRVLAFVVESGALRLAIARALNGIDTEASRPALKKAGLLTRDARAKERKKAGLKKARKAPQYSKR